MRCLSVLLSASVEGIGLSCVFDDEPINTSVHPRIVSGDGSDIAHPSQQSPSRLDTSRSRMP